MPASRNGCLISLRMASTPLSTSAVTMPDPMSPPPSTATHLILRGERPASVTPRTFLVERCAKKMWTSALCVSSAAAAANAAPSAFRPAMPPSVTPTWMASRHRCGCCRLRARFDACAREKSKIAMASASGSSLSVRTSERLRGRRPSAMSSAWCLAASRSCSRGTTSSTRPSLAAAGALMGVDVSIISTAFCRPTSRGSLCVPPNPGMIPSCSSGSPSRVPGVHTRALQPMATSRPPPSATPLMAATVGLAPPSSTAQMASLIEPSMPPPPEPLRNCWMSKPGLKLLLEPMTTTALTRPSPCASDRWRKSERSRSGCRAFSGG
mmetsp:Transcript_43085/g.129382  ORF Transcript_43085/g.129382 Transcript_43085/m.129382 type:complete len:324 (-) Transcript_43085:373-1344(-)